MGAKAIPMLVIRAKIHSQIRSRQFDVAEDLQRTRRSRCTMSVTARRIRLRSYLSAGQKTSKRRRANMRMVQAVLLYNLHNNGQYSAFKSEMATHSYMACVDICSAEEETTERSGYRTDVQVGGYKGTSKKMPDWKQQDAAESITTKKSQFIVDGDASGDRLGAVLSQREAKPERDVAEKCSALYGPCASSVHIFTVSDSYCGLTVVARWLARIRSQFYWPWKSGHGCEIPSAASWHGHSWAAGKDTNGELMRLGPDGQLLQMHFPFDNMEANTVAKVLVEKYIAYSGQCDDLQPFDMLANNGSDHEIPGVTPAIAMLGRESRPNDRMWLAMPRRGKLDREWEGPYQVVEGMGPQTYRVRHHGRYHRTLVVHSYQMKRYHAKDTTEQLDEGDPSVRDETTRRKKHQPPGAASLPSSEVRVETPARRRPPPGYLRDYIP
ncbi:hypothetical protein T03_14742 [Trichinella britovi]|uniref:Integrase p58-like C-terminal domain-containing protein n=1 Tax=Trichinella britovi TaxID=45882 RepID=A0A0V1CA48_TRIBR|nr:hypothetical protein T03_14742 [Trichinella britovi]